jgi:hypothetical protein
MYGPPKVLGKTAGAAVLPATGVATGFDSPLFFAAAVLFAGGLVAMVVSKLVAVKS